MKTKRSGKCVSELADEVPFDTSSTYTIEDVAVLVRKSSELVVSKNRTFHQKSCTIIRASARVLVREFSGDFIISQIFTNTNSASENS